MKVLRIHLHDRSSFFPLKHTAYEKYKFFAPNPERPTALFTAEKRRPSFFSTYLCSLPKTSILARETNARDDFVVETLVQDVFLKLWLHRDAIESPGHILSFTFCFEKRVPLLLQVSQK